MDNIPQQLTSDDELQHAMPEDSGPELALIVGAARSGTTLLRLLLDAHSEIGCPAEAGLPGLMSHMVRVWATIDADITEDVLATDPGQHGHGNQAGGATTTEPQDPDRPGENLEKPPDEPVVQLPGPAREWIRATTVAAMRRYCDREHKRLYVDKSLDSVYYRELVHQVYPEVRCVLAFRHVMDTIASGIEASPWGFQAYGYAAYVQSTPGNTVAALARYWLDHVSLALEWEKEHPASCIRVRYEDLVANPNPILKGIQDFLGVREDLTVLQRAFAREPARGPGDYKVEHTTAVHNDSVGHGKRVPVDMIPPPLLVAINEKLKTLGYSPLDRSWNTAERPVNIETETIWSQRLQGLLADAGSPIPHSDIGVFAVLAEDHLALRWIIDPEMGTITQGDGEVEAVLTGTAEDLVLMLTNEENLGVLLRSGRVRYVTADEENIARRDFRRELDAVVATLRSCLSEDKSEFPRIIAT